MPESRGVLREVAWRDLLPWLALVRAFRLSLQPAVLGAALLAAVMTPIGWRLARFVFRIPAPPATVVVVDQGNPPVAPVDPQVIDAREVLLPVQAAELSRLPGIGRLLAPDLRSRLENPDDRFLDRSPITYVFGRLSQPVIGMHQTITTLRGFAFFLFGTLWTLAVWGFAGGIITRIAAVEIGREEQASVRKAVRLTARRWFDLFTAPLYPVLGTLLIALLCAPVGLLLWMSDAGTIVAGLLWVFVLLASLVSALLLLWLLIGWPLMWPAIMSEETGDAFEGMNRSFAYAFQRPLHYLFYAVVAALFGYLCWLLFDLFIGLTLQAAHWSVSWGAGYPRLEEVFTPNQGEGRTAALRLGSEMIAWVEGLLLALSEAFAYAFFWVSATVIYLLLRQNVDQAEFDEVWLDDEVPRYPLPAMTKESPESTAPPASTLPPGHDAELRKTEALDNNQAE